MPGPNRFGDQDAAPAKLLNRSAYMAPSATKMVMKIPVKGSDRPMLVDDCDHALLSRYQWYLLDDGRNQYATTNLPGGKGTFSAHRLLMGHLVEPNHVVDHINRDGLDNQMSNLRSVYHKHNTWNGGPKGGTSKFKGVNLSQSGKKWRAQIAKGGVKHYIGVFDDEEDAARAYDKKATELFGEFAYLNFPGVE